MIKSTSELTCNLQVSYSFLTVGCEAAGCIATAVGAVVNAFSFFKAASLSALSLAICSLTLSLIDECYASGNDNQFTSLVFLLFFLFSALQRVSWLLS